MVIILDTDILIDLVNYDEGTVRWLQDLHATGEVLATTSLNAAELLRGAQRDSETLQATLKVMAGLHEIPFGPRASKTFGRLMDALDRAGRPVPAIDGMIAAAALEEGGRFATRNRRHFARIQGLQLVPEP